MKYNYLLKSIPFLSTLILIVLLNISNQKVNTKLKILIWNTPSSSLGTYLAISMGAGFFLSYVVTTNLSFINRFNLSNSIKYKSDNTNEDNVNSVVSNFRDTNEKILIERDINDPSPTINAQFRVIGKTERYNMNYADNDNIKYNNSNDYDESYFEDHEDNVTLKQSKEILNDWNDDSYTTW